MSQTGSGSYETSNSSEYIRRGNYKFVYSESPYLGSDADWEIDGEVYVYSRNIWISPTAKASGSDTLYVRSPGDNPFYEDWIDVASRVYNNDGEFVDVNILLTNCLGVELTNIEVQGYASSAGTGSLKVAG